MTIRCWVLEQSLDNTGWKFRITVKLQILGHNLWYLKIYNWIFELYHFTHNIVSKLIIYQVFDIGNDFIYKPLLLLITSSFETGLHHAAPLLILRYLKTVLYHCRVYWLFMGIRGHYFKAGLNNMVSVNVYWELVNVVFYRVWKG